MARFALLFLALTTLVAAALAAKSLPIDQAANAWDGGSFRAELVPEDGGCTLQGEILQDQVIDAALLPRQQAEEEEEEEPATLRPVDLDERVASRRPQSRRRSLHPQEEEDQENPPEQDLIIPPDQLPGENYPPARARDQHP